MKTRHRLKRFTFTFLGVTMLLIAGANNGFCEQVLVKEAVAVADLWQACEINSEHNKQTPEEKAARIRQMKNRQVLYLVSGDELRAAPPEKGPVLAYVVEYKPKGFVVVSGEDRIEPVLVFNGNGMFRFDQPERNFMRTFLKRALVGRWENLQKNIAGGKKPSVHKNWTEVRSRLKKNPGFLSVTLPKTKGGRGYHVEWDTALWGQGDPYNDTVIPHNGGIGGIPTGCTATAMAIQMRFHEWPPQGNGTHSYFDAQGGVQYFHSVNFGAHTYDWSAMPTGTLDPAQSYPEVADLMYHCGVAVDMNYEVGASGAWPSAISMLIYFLYKGTIELTSGHEAPVRDSILGGLPVVLSSTAHTVVASGYRDSPSPYYFLNCGWNGGSNDWYNLDQIPGGDPTIDRSYPFSSPMNYTYVDWSYGGSEYGTLQYPYNTLHEGNNDLIAGGQLWVAAGTYTGPGNEPITFSKAMKIVPYKGVVKIQ